jgi:NTE family protein
MQHDADVPRIAIACQGGGSHTAFSAGALKQSIVQAQTGAFVIDQLSGTSGGALSAALAWYGLQQQQQAGWSVEQTLNLIDQFWRENAAQLPGEVVWNNIVVQNLRLQSSGLLPELKTSPYALQSEFAVSLLQRLAPRPEFVDLEALLTRYFDFDRVIQQPGSSPRLLVGAVDVLSGQFKAFDSWKGEISVAALLASAALPDLFKAVEIGPQAYLDGLFSQNPPVRDFVDGVPPERKPARIRVIQINPTTRSDLPRTVSEIEDRRNELAGNLSLKQELYHIRKVNQWLANPSGRAAFPGKREIAIEFVRMSCDLAASLDLASKFDRSPALISRLLADGESQAQQPLPADTDHWLCYGE